MLGILALIQGIIDILGGELCLHHSLAHHPSGVFYSPAHIVMHILSLLPFALHTHRSVVRSHYSSFWHAWRSGKRILEWTVVDLFTALLHSIGALRYVMLVTLTNPVRGLGGLELRRFTHNLMFTQLLSRCSVARSSCARKVKHRYAGLATLSQVNSVNTR